MSDDEDEEDTIQEDTPIPPLGWTTKVWYKPGCESSVSHHRLMRILQTYYGDWNTAVEYVYTKHTVTPLVLRARLAPRFRPKSNFRNKFLRFLI